MFTTKGGEIFGKIWGQTENMDESVKTINMSLCLVVSEMQMMPVASGNDIMPVTLPDDRIVTAECNVNFKSYCNFETNYHLCDHGLNPAQSNMFDTIMSLVTRTYNHNSDFENSILSRIEE